MIEVRVNRSHRLCNKKPAFGGFSFLDVVLDSVHPEILPDEFQQMTHLEGL